MIENGIWHEAYDSDPAIVYALDEDLRLVRCNPAWDRFARNNGAPDLAEAKILGRCIMDVTPSVLRDFYGSAYEMVQKFRRQWWHVFDCSSPDVSRSFLMRVLPGEANSLLVINTLIREEPPEEQTTERIEEYTDADDTVTMCANCRRVENLSQPGRWDWIPLLLVSTEALVHPGLCPFCFAYHYGAGERERPGRPPR